MESILENGVGLGLRLDKRTTFALVATIMKADMARVTIALKDNATFFF